MSRSEVDAFYEAALSAGGRDNGPPGLRRTEAGYPPGYYAAFVLDPDDNNIEAAKRTTVGSRIDGWVRGLPWISNRRTR
jgi:hypothetical protein